MHWIGVYFYVCMFLDSKDKLLNVKFFSERSKKTKKPKKNKESVLVAESIYNSQHTVLKTSIFEFQNKQSMALKLFKFLKQFVLETESLCEISFRRKN